MDMNEVLAERAGQALKLTALKSEAPVEVNVQTCDLCIVGAGYSALNGLNVAAKYLPKGARVIVIDKREGWGGTWRSQYDFVRLHQPYPLFAAGDQPWPKHNEASHLATRQEVLDYLTSVPGISARHLEVAPLFGHEYSGHRVRNGRVEVDALPLSGGAAARPVRVIARRLLKATGWNIGSKSAFPLSSTRVRSVAPSDPVLRTQEFTNSKAPIYLIGSGKTSMDCALQFLRAGRTVHVILGSGMWYVVRDNVFPRGSKRYFQGTVFNDIMLRVAQRFDGHNDAEVIDSIAKEDLVLSVFGEAKNFRVGILSKAERDELVKGVASVYRGHLLDVDGTQMTLRQGGQQRTDTVPEGSWFINCTTQLAQIPHEPVLQDSGLTCSPQGVLAFTGMSSYFLTHLWYRNDLSKSAPALFRSRFDGEPKLRFATESSLAAMANFAMLSQHMPLSAVQSYQGDYGKWYPLHRQVASMARILPARGEMIRKAEKLLTLRYSDAEGGL